PHRKHQMLQVPLHRRLRGARLQQRNNTAGIELDAAVRIREHLDAQARVARRQPRPILLHQLRIAQLHEVLADLRGHCGGREFPARVRLALRDAPPCREHLLRHLAALV
ncbi:hypothetical protein KEM55_004113, partial [Ascosphaera atra]